MMIMVPMVVMGGCLPRVQNVSDNIYKHSPYSALLMCHHGIILMGDNIMKKSRETVRTKGSNNPKCALADVIVREIVHQVEFVDIISQVKLGKTFRTIKLIMDVIWGHNDPLGHMTGPSSTFK